MNYKVGDFVEYTGESIGFLTKRGKYEILEIDCCSCFPVCVSDEIGSPMWLSEKEFKMIRSQPKEGDIVWVRDSDDEEWRERIFLAEVPRVDYGFYCVSDRYRDNYLRGEIVGFTNWRHMTIYID